MNPEPVENKSPRRWRVSRRGFLIGLGATGGLLALGWGFGLPALRLKMAELFDSGEGAGGASGGVAAVGVSHAVRPKAMTTVPSVRAARRYQDIRPP